MRDSKERLRDILEAIATSGQQPYKIEPLR